MSLTPSGGVGGGGGDGQLVEGAGVPGVDSAPNGDRDSVDDVIERLLSVRGTLAVNILVFFLFSCFDGGEFCLLVSVFSLFHFGVFL